MPRAKKKNRESVKKKERVEKAYPETKYMSLDELAKIMRRDFVEAREEIVALCYEIPTSRMTEEMVEIYKTEMRRALYDVGQLQRMNIDEGKMYINAIPLGYTTLLKGWFRKVDATGPGAKKVDIPTKQQVGDEVWIMED